MTPLVKEMVSLDPEVALSCIWFDMGILPRYTFAWSELPGNRLPFEKCAIVGLPTFKIVVVFVNPWN